MKTFSFPASNKKLSLPNVPAAVKMGELFVDGSSISFFLQAPSSKTAKHSKSMVLYFIVIFIS
jgi:hypothetical protein